MYQLIHCVTIAVVPFLLRIARVPVAPRNCRCFVLYSVLPVSSFLIPHFTIMSKSLVTSRTLMRIKTFGRHNALSLHTRSSSLKEDASSGRKSSSVLHSTETRPPTEASLDLKPPKGTRDFYPADKRLQQWLFKQWGYSARCHGFEEYDAPVIENESLYTRKAGEEISQQLYNFSDKAGRRLSLRPEMTPSLCRMLMAKASSISWPVKWYSIPQCWRYEKTSRGRRREHYQWNMDIWGVSHVTAEAELISSIVQMLKSVQLSASDVVIKINSRTLLNELFFSLDIPPAKWMETCIIIDKLDKLPHDTIGKELGKIGIAEPCALRLLELLKAPLSKLQTHLRKDSNGVAEIMELKELLGAGYDVSDWIQFDASIVRGLGYYTGIVFEAYDREGIFRAICGGGRYDSLSTSMGGADIPAVGFGFGDAVITELLAHKRKLPSFELNTDTKVVVHAMSSSKSVVDAEIRQEAAALCSKLRANGIEVDLELDPTTKLKRTLNKANKHKIRFAIILAENEHARSELIIKDLTQHTQRVVSYSSNVCHELNQFE